MRWTVVACLLLAGCLNADPPVNVPDEPEPPWFIESAAARGMEMWIGDREEPEGRQGSFAVGDVDNDGWPDIYVVHDGPNKLFRNVDGTFEDITAASGTADVGDGHAALFVDLDNDGLQDLVIANRADPSRVLRNVGFGFEDVTEAWNMPDAKATSLAAADVDNDGDLDIVVGTDGGLLGPRPDILLLNDGAFTPEFLPEATRTHALVFCDIDMDGDQDLLSAGEPSIQWTNDEGFTATPRADAHSVICADLDQDARPDAFWSAHDPRGLEGTFGLQVRMRNMVPFDADGDGDLDIAANAGPFGAPDDEGPARLLEQVHVGTYADLAAFWGLEPGTGRGISAVDIDRDGDQDLLMAMRGELRVYENVAPQQPLTHLRLEGTASNRDAIGTKVWGEGDETRYAERSATQGLSQAGPYVSIQGARIEVEWPSGTTQTFKGVEAGAYRLIEGGGLEKLEAS